MHKFYFKKRIIIKYLINEFSLKFKALLKNYSFCSTAEYCPMVIIFLSHFQIKPSE